MEGLTSKIGDPDGLGEIVLTMGGAETDVGKDSMVGSADGVSTGGAGLSGGKDPKGSVVGSSDGLPTGGMLSVIGYNDGLNEGLPTGGKESV